MTAKVISVSLAPDHEFSKAPARRIRLIAGRGVEGDAHNGVTVKHRSRVAKDPTVPNLRQVHLLHGELFDELAAKGFSVKPADLGENVTTEGIDLLGLPAGAQLRIGPSARIEITGLRNPCKQIEAFAQGLLAATLDRDAQGNLVRKAGVMAIVLEGGDVSAGDSIFVELPAGAHRALEPV